MAYENPVPARRAEAYDFERQPDGEPPLSADEQRLERLNALGMSLSTKRDEAVRGRQASGIEQEWLEDDEHYEGIDDANRGEHRLWQTRPPGQVESKSKSTQSSLFLNITRPYCDAASARVADMLLPTDDRAWSIKTTPIPELIDLSKGLVSPSIMSAVAAAYPDPVVRQAAVQHQVALAMQQIEDSKKRASAAEKRIEDWHVECQFHGHVRQVIEDSARIGAGVLKGPVPVKRKGLMWQKDGVVLKDEVKPASMRVNVWNLFPDPACGESIHNGSYLWERDTLSKRRLSELRDAPGYIPEAIEACIAEGPQTFIHQIPQVNMPRPESKNDFEVWYYYGVLEKDDLEAAGCDCSEVPADRYLAIPALVTMVNARVIKAALQPLDSGEFPYDVMVWQRRAGHWAGIGVSRQIRTPQRLVNGAGRHLADNAGLSAGGQIVLKPDAVSPADHMWALTPRKIWYVSKDYEGPIDEVFSLINLPSLQTDLMAIIQFGLKMAEDVTGLPLILQGQQGKAPDTVGGMTMLNNNASAVLRRLARLFDDLITEPHIRRYYTWIMQYGAESEKGDFQIDARGSSALVEREVENQTITEMAEIVTNPVFGADPRKWFAEFLKGRRLDPKRFQFDDEKWREIVENMAKEPQDPRLAVEQVRAQVQERMRQLDGEIKATLTMLEQKFEAEQGALDRQLQMVMAEFEQTGQKSITFDQLKVKLAETAMKLRTQRELTYASLANRAPKEVTKPPTEPAGRAPAGQAFQR